MEGIFDMGRNPSSILHGMALVGNVISFLSLSRI